jgi:hypothetical protein
MFFSNGDRPLRATLATLRSHDVARGIENHPMVNAATPVTPAALSVADDLRRIRPSPRTPAGLESHDFYCWPGRELGGGFRCIARRITTYERRPER